MSYSIDTHVVSKSSNKPEIYIGNNSDDQILTFTIDNTGDDIVLDSVKAPISSKNPTGDYDFSITFKAGFITELEIPDTGLTSSTGWTFYSDTIQGEKGSVTGYLINKAGTTITGKNGRQPGETLEFYLAYSTVSAPGDMNNPTTTPHVSVDTNIVENLTTSNITQPDELNVLLSGLEELPLAVEFVGNRTLVNDGSKQTLTFQLINTSDEDSIFVNSAETKLRIWFDLDENTPSPWALGPKSVVTDGTTLTVDIKPVDISGSASTAWTVTPPNANATNLIWTLAPATATTSITPYAHDAADPSTARPSFQITGLNTTAVPGWTNMYVQYEDILGYSDAVLVARIEKSGMIAGQIPGQIFNMGSTSIANTEVSTSSVAICSSSTTYPAADTLLAVQPNLTLHNPDVTENNGTLLAFSSQVSNNHSVAAAGIATEFSDRAITGAGVSGDMVFYTGTQGKGLLEQMRIAKDGTTTFQQAVNANSTLTAVGTATLQGAVTANSSLTVGGATILQGAATANNSLTVAGITTLNDTLTITKDDWGKGDSATLSLGGTNGGTNNSKGTSYSPCNIVNNFGDGLTLNCVSNINPGSTGNTTVTGNLGIGVAPIAPLHVSGNTALAAVTSAYYGYLNDSGATGWSGDTDLPNNVTAYFTGGRLISTGEIDCMQGTLTASDARIKDIGKRSNTNDDLATLNQLEVTEYFYKSLQLRGKGKQKKLIGQQVHEIYPSATRQRPHAIPDIEQLSKSLVFDSDTQIATINLCHPHQLINGERVHIQTNTGDMDVDVLSTPDKHSFTVTLPQDPGEQVFVSGRWVDDFQLVDYEAISMLNVSATQKLSQRLDAAMHAIDVLQQENAKLQESN